MVTERLPYTGEAAQAGLVVPDQLFEDRHHLEDLYQRLDTLIRPRMGGDD